MAESHVVTALIARRSELAGRIEHAQKVLCQLIVDLGNLDATLRLFVPDIDLIEVRPKLFPPRLIMFKGEIARLVLETLRVKNGPMNTYEIAAACMKQWNMNTSDQRIVRSVSKRVGSCLRHHRGKGIVRSKLGPGQYMLWQIVR